MDYGIGVRALRHYPDLEFPGGISPDFRVRHDAISAFRDESTPYRSFSREILAIFPRNS
jgi:hypothetical protein